MNNTMAWKAETRKKMRSQRSKLGAETRQAGAEAVVKLACENSLFKQSEHIACYFASGYELDTQALIHAIWEQGKQCYLPVLTGETEATLNFVLYTPEDELKLNKFNILEPQSLDTQAAFPVAKLDLVFLPLLAFDMKGNRLGSGGGYYDRTFHAIKASSKKPYLIGLAFAQQQAEDLQHDQWDVRLDGVLTQEKFTVFN